MMGTEMVNERTRLVQSDVTLESELLYKENITNFRITRRFAIGSGLAAVVALVGSVVSFKFGNSWPFVLVGTLLAVGSLGGAVGACVSGCMLCDKAASKLAKIKLIVADPVKRQALTRKLEEGSFIEINAYMYQEQISADDLKNQGFLGHTQAEALYRLRNIWDSTVVNTNVATLASVKTSIEGLLNSTWARLIGPV